MVEETLTKERKASPVALKHKKEREEKLKKKKKSGWGEYWKKVKRGEAKPPWEIHKERLKKAEKEKKKETSNSSQIQKSEEETEELKEQAKEITEEKILGEKKESPLGAKPTEKPPEEKPQKKIEIDFNIWILVGIAILALLVMQTMREKETIIIQEKPKSEEKDYYEIEVYGGRKKRIYKDGRVEYVE